MFYGNYANRVKSVIAEARSKKDFEKGLSNFGGIDAAIPTKDISKLVAEQRAFANSIQLNGQPLNSILTPHCLKDAKVGLHPDFKHLKNTSETEEHYIVSVFIDIKGSTDLFKEYENVDVYRITNTIQSAAIHTCLAIGGHIQRLHGDGVFAYFGGKNKTKEEAVYNALVACSMITYFVKNDLKNIFLEDGVEGIKTRIGIDFGDDDDVLWANFGLLDVSELTTVSLHTSLASKMQSYAKPNGIVVGQNVRDKLLLDESFYDLVRDSYGEVKKRYIFSNPKESFYYTQYCFDWYKFLKTLPFVKVVKDGELEIIDHKKIEEEERVNRLIATATAVNSGTAYLNKYGQINTENKGVKHEPHRFHYGSIFFRNGRSQFTRKSVLRHHKEHIETNYKFLKCHFDNNVLVCIGSITHEDYKNVYEVEIRCVEGYEPKTTIKSPTNIKPSLEIHMYSDHSLCLHYPKDMKWTGRTPIYKYTIPWLVEWVHFYELYLVNGGKWLGRESPAHFTSADMNIGEDLV